jgi:hypothetical protein
MYIYGHLQMFPGKRIVIAEFGWPSAGYNLKNANPARSSRLPCCGLRNRAEAIGIDYNIVGLSTSRGSFSKAASTLLGRS